MKPAPTTVKTTARPYVRPTARAMACARPGASLVPVEVAPAPPKPVNVLLPLAVVEAPELPVAEDPLEVVDAMELIVDELTRVGFWAPHG